MSNSERVFPRLPSRTDGSAAVQRYREAHTGHPSRLHQVEQLGARALISASVVLGVDPVGLGFGLGDGQIATMLAGGERFVSAEIVERRVEIAVACVAAWGEQLARRIRREANLEADRLARLPGEIRDEWHRLQELLEREGTVRQTVRFTKRNEEFSDPPTRGAEPTIQDRLATTAVEVLRQQSDLVERDATVSRLEDERLRLLGRVEELEDERARLQTAVGGWKREAEQGHLRKRGGPCRGERMPAAAPDPDGATASIDPEQP